MQNFFKTKEWELLWPFYIKVFIYSMFNVTVAFSVIYFFNIGLSYSEIGKLVGITGLSTIIFEIPTGVVADLLGRKFSTLFGLVIVAFCHILIPLTNSFLILAFIFGAIGFGTSFISGAYTAWFVDYLKYKRKKHLIHNAMIKFSSLASAGNVFAPLFGSILVTFLDLKWLWVIQGSGMLFSILILGIFGKEKFHKRKRTELTNLFKKSFTTTKKAIHFSFKNRNFLLMLIASIFAMLFMASGLCWQPFLVKLKMPVSYLGVFYSIIAFVGIFSPFLSKPLLVYLGKEKNVFIFSTMFGGLLILTLYFIHQPMFYFACAILIIQSIIGKAMAPTKDAYLQKLIPSKIRATAGSLTHMLISVFSIIGAITAGKVMDLVGPKFTLIYFCGFLIPAIVCYLLLKQNTSSQKIF